MRNLLCVLGIVLLLALATEAIPPQAPPGKNLSWAFPAAVEKNEPPAPDPTGPIQLPGSTKSYTQAQVDDLANPPDWFPDEHPMAPDIVRSGAGNKGFACVSCHLMSGIGHPESADIAGLPADYIIEQMGDFKSGDRKDPARMNGIAQNTTDADVKAAAAYFASLKDSSVVGQGDGGRHCARHLPRPRAHAIRGRWGRNGADRQPHHRGACKPSRGKKPRPAYAKIHPPMCPSEAWRKARRWR